MYNECHGQLLSMYVSIDDMAHALMHVLLLLLTDSSYASLIDTLTVIELHPLLMLTHTLYSVLTVHCWPTTSYHVIKYPKHGRVNQCLLLLRP